MNDWRTVKLADLGPITTGKTPPSSKPDSFGGSIPFVTPSDMLAGRYIWSTSRSLTEAGLRTVSKRMLPAGCVLVSCIGSDMGKTYIASRSCFTNQQINSIEVTDRGAHPLYVYYNLSGRKAELQQLASGSSAQPILNKSNFSQISLELPPIAEQTAIADLLSSLDDKIELNRRTNETLEAMAQAIFRDWFVDFGPTRRKIDGATDPVEVMGGLVSDPDRARELAALFPAVLGDDGLPEGWREGTLGDVARTVGISVLPAQISPNTPYIGLEHMPRRSIALTEWEAASKVSSNKSAFRRGQILFGKLRPYFHKVGLAPVDGVCSTDIIVLDAIHGQARPMVTACVSTDEFIAFTDQGSTGTKMPRTSWGNMKKYQIALATDAVVASFAAVASPLMDKIVAAIHENRTLAATRDLLLPRLMSGEIRLRDAERQIEAVA